MLREKRLLITGVVNPDSIAFAIAERAQLLGAEVALSAPPRDLERATETARTLPRPADVIEADLTDPAALAGLTETLASRFGRVDGAVHAVAFAPRDALSGAMADADPAGIELAFRTSAVSLSGLARATAPLFPADGGSLVGLTFHSEGAWPFYNWMGVCKSALESVGRYLARDLGPSRSRVNIVAAGPLRTRAASGIPDFERLVQAWEAQSALPWDPQDAGPVADAICFLLSDLARGITAEVLHVDGGYHAMAMPLREPAMRTQAAADADTAAAG